MGREVLLNGHKPDGLPDKKISWGEFIAQEGISAERLAILRERTKTILDGTFPQEPDAQLAMVLVLYAREESQRGDMDRGIEVRNNVGHALNNLSLERQKGLRGQIDRIVANTPISIAAKPLSTTSAVVHGEIRPGEVNGTR